jgi:penicillin-binding protein 2
VYPPDTLRARLRPFWSLIVCALLLGVVACQSGGAAPTATVEDESSASSNPAAEDPTAAPPDERALVDAFLLLWRNGAYEQMYAMLDPASQASISLNVFTTYYESFWTETTATSLAGEVSEQADQSFAIDLSLSTRFFGDLAWQVTVPVVETGDGRFAISWSRALLHPDLLEGQSLKSEVVVPRRGAILDRNGQPLAQTVSQPVVGIARSLIQDVVVVKTELARLFQITYAEVDAALASELPLTYFVPVRSLPHDTPQDALNAAATLPGVFVRNEELRIYTMGEPAAHVVGYMREIYAEELADLEPLGYTVGDLVGGYGVEGDMETELAGQRGGRLFIVNEAGAEISEVASREPRAGSDVHLSIDPVVQQAAFARLGDMIGSIVVVNPKDNSILAMVSSPSFDPTRILNGEPGYLSNLVADTRNPLLNRAAHGVYSAGSTFKVVTGAAGLEAGVVATDTRLPCPVVWNKLGEGFEKRNWQNFDRGYLTVAEGLMTSCNPVFYEIAYQLDLTDSNLLPNMARMFGYGEPTGIVGLYEEAGLVPDQAWKNEVRGEPWFTGDAVNLGIGQGDLLVTNLQIANAYSSLVGSRQVRKLVLVSKVVGPDGEQTYAADVLHPLALSEATIEHLLYGTQLVTLNPGGTAYYAFGRTPLALGGKSGSAEDAGGQSHALFASYGPIDDPTAVAVVILDDGNSGSLEAGPIARDAVLAALGF